MRGLDSQSEDSAPAGDSASADRITVRFESTPQANLYAKGSKQRLCATPCDLTIVRNNPDSPGKRAYVLRRNGYRAHRLSIDLGKPPRTVQATLRRLPRGSSARGREEPEPPVETGDSGKKAETEPTDKPEPARVEPNEDPKPPKDKIDPSVTLDPFGRK